MDVRNIIHSEKSSIMNHLFIHSSCSESQNSLLLIFALSHKKVYSSHRFNQYKLLQNPLALFQLNLRFNLFKA